MRKSVVENGLKDRLAYGEALNRCSPLLWSAITSFVAVISTLAVAITQLLTYLPATAVSDV